MHNPWKNEKLKQLNAKPRQQDSNTISEIINSEKQESFNRIEMKHHTAKHLWQNTNTREKMNEEILKRIMSEKINTLPSLRKKDWKTIKEGTDNNEQIINIYLNESDIIESNIESQK